MKRDVLEQKFSSELIKTRKGAFGQELAYIPGHAYVARLNEAFKHKWSFEVVTHEVHGHELVVLGKLNAEGVTKMAFGGASMTVNKATGETLSIADDLKAAATDSLKKACSLFGIGLHLQATEYVAKNDHVESATHISVGLGKKQPEQLITKRQLAAVWAIGKRLGRSSASLQAYCRKTFGVDVESLDKAMASILIGQLKKEIG